MKRITIEPVSRIEGHAKVTIQLDDAGKIAGTEFNITQVRGFEKFTEGRPFYEMPAITSRICGICPISHLLASSKACDAIMAVQIPAAARNLRELVHCGQFVQSHALSFFYLSAPDFLLGMDSDPAARNILGIVAKHPEVARDGIELRKFGLQVIEGLAQERVHPAWIVAGGVATSMTQQLRDRILTELPAAKAITERTIHFFSTVIDDYAEELAHFGSEPTMYAGLVREDGTLGLYDGALRFTDSNGKIVHDGIPAADYSKWIGEASVRDSYLKAPYFRPSGFPAGLYRVGPLARLNVANTCGTPKANAELRRYRERFGAPGHSAFLYHYARLIEILYALERIEMLLADPMTFESHVRASAGVNALEGVGMIEAPRGVLIHHYNVNEEGAITRANLIVATGHNNLAIGKGIRQVGEHFIDGTRLEEGMLNRVSALVRAYDPCFSCSTHALGQPPITVRLVGSDGELLDEVSN